MLLQWMWRTSLTCSREQLYSPKVYQILESLAFKSSFSFWHSWCWAFPSKISWIESSSRSLVSAFQLFSCALISDSPALAPIVFSTSIICRFNSLKFPSNSLYSFRISPFYFQSYCIFKHMTWFSLCSVSFSLSNPLISKFSSWMILISNTSVSNLATLSISSLLTAWICSPLSLSLTRLSFRQFLSSLSLEILSPQAQTICEQSLFSPQTQCMFSRSEAVFSFMSPVNLMILRSRAVLAVKGRLTLWQESSLGRLLSNFLTFRAFIIKINYQGKILLGVLGIHQQNCRKKVRELLETIRDQQSWGRESLVGNPACLLLDSLGKIEVRRQLTTSCRFSFCLGVTDLPSSLLSSNGTLGLILLLPNTRDLFVSVLLMTLSSLVSLSDSRYILRRDFETGLSALTILLWLMSLLDLMT